MARKRSIGVTIEGLRELNAAIDALSSRELNHAIMDAVRGKGGREMAKTMRQLTPKRTGMTHRYTKVWDEGGYKDDVEIGYKGPLSFGNRGGGRFQVGAWLESGTKPHEIKAHRDKHGMFVKGKFVTHVNHPGIKGRKMAKRAMEMHEGRMLYHISRQIDIMLKRKASV